MDATATWTVREAELDELYAVQDRIEEVRPEKRSDEQKAALRAVRAEIRKRTKTLSDEVLEQIDAWYEEGLSAYVA